MTFRLILIRHAKSSWDDPLCDDHDRRLNERGRDAADKIGTWMAKKGYVPSAVLSSTARRTVETWKGLSKHIDGDIQVEFRSTLYHASPQAMLTAIGGRREKELMLLGHNPGIAALAEALVDTRPSHPQFGQYPTAATAIIDFDTDVWASIRPETGKLIDFVVPRDLG